MIVGKTRTYHLVLRTFNLIIFRVADRVGLPIISVSVPFISLRGSKGTLLITWFINGVSERNKTMSSESDTLGWYFYLW